MQHPIRYLITFFCLVLATGSVASPDEPDDAWTLNFYLENDLFGATDANYTNGVRMSWISPDLESWAEDPAVPGFLNRINNELDELLGFKKGQSRNLVVSLGHLIYTPEDRQASRLLEGDRPYAGYLYLGLAYQSRTDNRLDTLEVDVGIVGPSAQGELAQDSFHDLWGIEQFNGWDNQLRDEPILQFTYEYRRRFFRHQLPGGLEQDFIGHMGGALGSASIHANFGGEYRIGWDLPEDFGTSAVRPGGDNSAPGSGDARLSPRAREGGLSGLHLFMSLDTQLVARDIFLDGNTWQDSHSIDKKHLVADLSVGVSFLLERWKFSYGQVFRTREFEGQPHSHQYGSLGISYTW